MNVIVCDDDLEFIEDLEKIIIPIIKKEYETAKVLNFSSGTDLLLWYSQTSETIDILLIDIEMPGFNGLDVVRSLRCSNCDCFIIFISSYQTYVLSALDYGIVHYLLKPVDPQKLSNVLCKVLSEYKLKHNTIELRKNNEHIFLTIDSIILIESNTRKLTYYTLDDTYIIPGKISDAQILLLPFEFLRVHKSFLINMNKVIKYEGCTFYLQGNHIAEISHVNRSSIISAYNDFVLKKIIN